MTDSTDASDATSELPPTPPEAPLPPTPSIAGAPVAAPVASPFIPVYKEPWLNPAKRTKAIVAGVVAALVLLGAGFAIGAGVTHRHDRRDGGFQRTIQVGPGQFGWVPGNAPAIRRGGVLYGPGQKGVRPGNPIPRQGTASGVPSPVPVPAHT